MSGLYWIWAKASYVFLERGLFFAIEEIRTANFISHVIVWMITIFVYALLLTIYLSIIGKKFIRKDYQLRAYEYTFLILPSIATLCISITLKMMIISVENGIATAIFEKVPATMFWVPLISLLLLGVIIASVILFQKLVQLGEEEKKHAMLENQMVQMQREFEEIQDIYADMTTA